MRITKPMREALEYAASVQRVLAWPLWIKGGTVRRLRREGFLDTYVTSGMQLGSGIRFGGHIDDEITPKGREAISVTKPEETPHEAPLRNEEEGS